MVATSAEPVTCVKLAQRPKDKGTTIAPPPLEVHCVFEDDFVSFDCLIEALHIEPSCWTNRNSAFE